MLIINPYRHFFDWCLLNHINAKWRANRSYECPELTPKVKNYCKRSIKEHLPEPVQSFALECFSNFQQPEFLLCQYKSITDAIQMIPDPDIREFVDINRLYGLDAEDIERRLKVHIYPRKIKKYAVKKYLYFFWYILSAEIPYAGAALKQLLKNNTELTQAYGNLLKFNPSKISFNRYNLIMCIDIADKIEPKEFIRTISLANDLRVEAIGKSDYPTAETLTRIVASDVASLKSIGGKSEEKSIAKLFRALTQKDDNYVQQI